MIKCQESSKNINVWNLSGSLNSDWRCYSCDWPLYVCLALPFCSLVAIAATSTHFCQSLLTHWNFEEQSISAPRLSKKATRGSTQVPSIQKTTRARNNYWGIIFRGIARNCCNRLCECFFFFAAGGGGIVFVQLREFVVALCSIYCFCSMLLRISLRNGLCVIAPKYFRRVMSGWIARDSRDHCAK